MSVVVEFQVKRDIFTWILTFTPEFAHRWQFSRDAFVSGLRRNHFQSGSLKMLVLSRRVNEQLVIGNDVVITVQRISGNRITLGIEAPPASANSPGGARSRIKQKS